MKDKTESFRSYLNNKGYEFFFIEECEDFLLARCFKPCKSDFDYITDVAGLKNSDWKIVQMIFSRLEKEINNK